MSREEYRPPRFEENGTAYLGPGETARAAEILRRGGVVAVPTETVYGLAANGLDEAAVGRIFAAKGRPENKPVSLFVRGIRDAGRFCQVNEAARRLSVLWPGPLTVILPRLACVPDVITAGGEGVGIRVPDDPVTLELLALCGFPLTGTSANLSGEEAAVSGREALEIFRGRIDAVLDGGVSPGGVPSTVVDLTGPAPKILRQGAILKETLEKLIGTVV